MGAMGTEPTVRLEVADGIGVIRLARPPANVLGTPEAEGLVAAAREARGRDDVRAIVVTGGERFSGGADLAELSAAGPAEAVAISRALAGAIAAIEELPLVTIAAIEGFALGGGLELALGCDLRVASREAKLGLPEVTLGIMPGAGGTQRLPRAVGYDRAREMVLTGRRVEADEALALGLIHRVAPAGEAFDVAMSLATAIAAGPTRAYAAAKGALRGSQVDPARGIVLEREAFAALFATDDRAEGLSAFREKRPPRFTGR